MVREFHELVGGAVESLPCVPSAAVIKKRSRLISEEYEELMEAMAGGDVVQIAQEMADLVYVVFGEALEYGIDLTSVTEEVHSANMTKIGPEGKVIVRPDGKILKPDGWRPPDVRAVLARQGGHGLKPPQGTIDRQRLEAGPESRHD